MRKRSSDWNGRSAVWRTEFGEHVLDEVRLTNPHGVADVVRAGRREGATAMGQPAPSLFPLSSHFFL